jgi:hypothetical protein
MPRGVVEVEDGGGGYLVEQRLEDGRVRGNDGLEQAEARRWLLRGLVVGERLGQRRGRRGVLAGVGVPEQVLGLWERSAHAFCGL